MPNKIGWCDMTWNPVWGCFNNCEYCYAQKIAGFRYNQMAENEYYCHFWGNERTFKDRLNKGDIIIKEYSEKIKNFIPIFLEGQYWKKLPKKPQRIFVGSMSEIYYWQEEWMKRVIEKVKQYPQHTFQFLTKFPEVYPIYKFPKNCWLGTTMTSKINLDAYNYFTNRNNIKYVSFEPLLNNMVFTSYLRHFDWVIIGAETGNRKNKVIPKIEWIDKIVNYCRDRNIPIYLKDSLKNIYPAEIKEFPLI